MGQPKLKITSIEEKRTYEAETKASDLWEADSLFEQLTETTAKFPNHNAISFQIKSGPKDKALRLTWSELKDQVCQAANLFRRLGVTEKDVVAYVLPNCLEAPLTLLAGATAGIVNPVNPLLDVEQIGAILRETGAKVVVTLAPFPKTDVNEKVTKAAALAPNVKTILEVDLKRYLTPPTIWLVPLLRPKPVAGGSAKVMDFNKAVAAEPKELSFTEITGDRFCAYFHTGGTTGMPKVAQHRASGILYNGWCGCSYMFTEEDVLFCPLPMFHVFAAYPVLMSALTSGAEVVFPTPAGYRGDGVFDNFWKLIERYKATFMITVPTAAAALMQRPVDADVSTLRYALCGSAPLPVELFRKFEKATGVKILEGYGMTETTCLVSINPPHGEPKIGSVGLPFPHTRIRILMCDSEGNITKECGTDEIGEICVDNPGVVQGACYTEEDKNIGLYADGKFLRTGDLGRRDADGYLWITGRAKDLIIRGGHNIDPAEIEEALASHEAVAFAGAIGQPDAHSGEVPAAYVELVAGAEISEAALITHAESLIGERAAQPKFLKIMDELPKTAVGKVFKPDLRKEAIARIYTEALNAANISAEIDHVFEDKKRGLVAVVASEDVSLTDEAVTAILGRFARPWVWKSDL